MSRRRSAAAPSNLRAALVEEARQFDDYRAALHGGVVPPNPQAEELEAGGPVELDGRHLERFVPGLDPARRYVVTGDGTVTEATGRRSSTPGPSVGGAARWRRHGTAS